MLILEKNGFDARVLSYFRGILCHPSIFYPKKRFHIIKRSFHHDVSDFSLSFLLPRFIFLLKFNFAFSFVIYIIFWSIFFFSQLDELNLYFTPFIYFRYRNLSSLSSFLFRYLCFTVYSLLLVVYLQCVIYVFLLYDLWISHYVIYTVYISFRWIYYFF